MIASCRVTGIVLGNILLPGSDGRYVCVCVRDSVHDFFMLLMCQDMYLIVGAK